jgi:twitching motility protein PilT
MKNRLTESDINAVREELKNDLPSGLETAYKYLSHEHWNDRKTAAELIGSVGSRGLDFLFAKISTETKAELIQNACYWACIIMFDAGSVEIKTMEQLFTAGDNNIRKRILERINDVNLRGELQPFLYRALGFDSWEVREKAFQAFLSIGTNILPFLEEQFTNANNHQQFWTFKIFAILLKSEAIRHFSNFIRIGAKNDKIQIYAVSNLGEIHEPKVVRTLLNFLKTDSFLINEEVFRSLCKLAATQMDEFIRILSSEPEIPALAMLLRVIESTCDANILERISFLFYHTDYQVRYLAYTHLCAFPSKKTAKILIRAFSDERWSIRKSATEKIAQLGTYAIADLLEAIESDDDNIVFWALQSLRRIREPITLGAIAALLEKSSKELRLFALDVIAAIDTEQSCEIFLEAFCNKLWEVRQKASELFPNLTHFPLPHLLEGCISKNEHVRFWSFKTLDEMSCKGTGTLLEQIKEQADRNPYHTIKNLKLCPQDLLLAQLKKHSPVLFQIEESIAMNSSSASGQSIAGGSPQQIIIQPAVDNTIVQQPLPDTGNVIPYELPMDELLTQAFNLEASDIHIKINQSPLVRVTSKINTMKFPPITPEQILLFIKQILPPHLLAFLERNCQADASYETPDGIRLRINIYKTMNGYEIAGRFITEKLPSFENLNLPTAVMQKLCHLENGLVILTGPTGSGKTSTLAAMIDYINMLFQKHIICIEDPIEYVHKAKCCYVSQREVLRDVPSYPMGIRATLREDPDVILVGELRDRESVETAMTLAGTGHLVLTTLHAPTATTAVEQLQDFFADDQKDHIRKQIAFNLKAIISQRLLRHKNGRTRLPAVEILVTSPAVKNVIRDGKTEQLPTIIETSKKEGMISLDQALKTIVQSDKVSLEEVWPHVVDQKTFSDSFSRER